MASVQLPRTAVPSTALAPTRTPADSTVHYSPRLSKKPLSVRIAEDTNTGSSEDTEDSENIPYHAREYARPFTYGSLPVDFKSSDLNHVELPEDLQPEDAKVTRSPITPLPPSPSLIRKSNRPSISPSRPVLRKTPTRQEFEEMLMERREQAMREQNNTATQLAQNASIQKDLDELQVLLNKKGIIHRRGEERRHSPTERTVRYVETVDLPSVPNEHQHSGHSVPISSVKKASILKSGRQSPEEKRTTAVEMAPKRSETPTFPVALKPIRGSDNRCESPYPLVAAATPGTSPAVTTVVGRKNDYSQRGRLVNFNEVGQLGAISSDTHEVEPHLVKFVKDCSEYWYKPHISREEAVALLRNTVPGTFIIRNSTTYKNAYGLVLRVAKPPTGIVVPDNSAGDELVRHFLLEPTTRGVRLKGCTNEPVFTSLSALVYEHSVNQLALPCKLIVPNADLLQSTGDVQLIAAQRKLLEQGAACNVLYLFSCNMESLTGDEAVRKSVLELFARRTPPKSVEVHFKVSQCGITLTDNTRSMFFRRHYAPVNISHFAIDPENRYWRLANDQAEDASGGGIGANKTIFAFVARPTIGPQDNECHVFCDLADAQPASAIVSFANKVLPMDKHYHEML